MRHPFLCALGLLAATLGGARAETLTLEQCLSEVARNNPVIAVQRSEMQASLGTQLVLRSRALPKFGVGVYAGQQGDEGTSIERAGSLTDSSGKPVAFPEQRIDRGARYFAIGTAQFVQPLFDAAIPPSWRRGRLETALAESNFVTVASAQLHQARLLYYAAQYYRESARILGEVASRLDADSKTISDMFKAGLVGRQRLLQAQVQRVSYDTPIQAYQGNYQVNLAALWRLMGRERAELPGDPLKDVTLGGSLDDAQVLSFDPAQVIPTALKERSDLQYLREVVQAYKEDARITRAGYYPTVQILISGQALPQNFVRSDRPNAIRAGDEIDTNQIRFGGRYSWTVIDTGAVQGGAQRIDRLRGTLEASLRHLEDNIPRDLALLKAQSENITAQTATFNTNTALAGDTLKIVSDAEKQGTSSQLDILDAENGALNTQLGLLNVQLLANNAHAEFDRITGAYVRLVDEQSASPQAPRHSTHDKDR